MVEQLTLNQRVVGSSPTRFTKISPKQLVSESGGQAALVQKSFRINSLIVIWELRSSHMTVSPFLGGRAG
jgi:hypothetical protein